MRYAFPQYFNDRERFLSYTVVHSALIDAGHEVVKDIDADVDAVLFSMCDVTEYRRLMAMRKEAKDKPLIVGGAFAFNFWSAKLYADAVWVGEVYEMADCQTLQELYESPHCYTGEGFPIASQRIDWEKVPLVRNNKRRCYYWGGVGCRNHCRFCFTSWTHKHQVNSRSRIMAAKREARKRHMYIMVASNEFDTDPGSKTFDMLLETYLSRSVKGNMVRCGIEFATDETRRKNGKPITRSQIYRAIKKSYRERVQLRLFHIAGYDDLADWERYIDEFGAMMEDVGYDMMFQLGFNNLQYQNYTPLYAERRDIKPENYIDIHKVKEWHDRLVMRTKSVHIVPPSPFEHVCCRMGLELATTRDQVDFWASMLVNPRKKLTQQAAYDALFETGIFDTPALVLNPSTGEISINEKWS